MAQHFMYLQSPGDVFYLILTTIYEGGTYWVASITLNKDETGGNETSMLSML